MQKAGAITPTSALGHLVSHSADGAITPTGGLTNVKVALIAVAGAIGPAGTHVSNVLLPLAGSVTPTGAVANARRAALAVGGSITPAGVHVATAEHNPSGSITPSGGLTNIKVAVLAIGGTIAPTGVAAQRPAVSMAGAITPAGVHVSVVTVPRGGSITPTSVLANQKLASVALAGAITPTGALVAVKVAVEFSVNIAGGIAPTGTLALRVSHTQAGGITPAGALTLVAAVPLGGAITPSAVLDTLPVLALGGTITPTSPAIVWRVDTHLSGAVTPIGALLNALTNPPAALDEFDVTRTASSKTPGHRLNNWTATIAPVATDDADSDYEVGSRWVNVTTDIAYECADSSVGAAVWLPWHAQAHAIASHSDALFPSGVTVGVDPGGADGFIEVADDGTNDHHIAIVNAEAATTPPRVSLFKARGSPASPAAAVTGDGFGQIWFYGHDGTNYELAAKIEAVGSSAIGDDDMPGAVQFWTTPDGTTTPVLRWSVNHAGDLNPDGNANDVGSAGDNVRLFYRRADRLDAPQTPAELTLDTNDWSLGTVQSVVRASSDASRNVTGIVAISDMVLRIINVGTNPIVIKDQDAGSMAANRFAIGADVTLTADRSVIVWYDTSTSRWRLFASGS